LPPATKAPKASITRPAAAVPVWPSDRIRRVEATLSASRSIVASSRMVGKLVSSNGLAMKITVSRITTEKVIEIASDMSRSQVGNGISSTAMIATMPSGSHISELVSAERNRP
jgi:hypothetical protein